MVLFDNRNVFGAIKKSISLPHFHLSSNLIFKKSLFKYIAKFFVSRETSGVINNVQAAGCSRRI